MSIINEIGRAVIRYIRQHGRAPKYVLLGEEEAGRLAEEASKLAWYLAPGQPDQIYGYLILRVKKESFLDVSG